MQFNAELTGDAAALARTHSELLARLPATVSAFVLVELQKWPLLFPPEQQYQRALLDHLSHVPAGALEQSTAGIARIEADAGLTHLSERNPARYQDEAQALLRKRGQFVPWRTAVDAWFQKIDPALEAQLYPADAPRRLIVQIYGSEIAVQRDKLWRRFKKTGVRVPLNLDGAAGSDRFLVALFGGSDDRRAASPLLDDAWIIEAHEALHTLCEGHARPGALTGLSYDRLRGFRDDLTRTLNAKIQSGVESPHAFAAYARGLRLNPAPGAMLHADEITAAFVRDVLLAGNGTLFVNNTFVEWSAAQALRRAQPRVLVTRFGVRDKLKPFSSMVMFSQARPTDHQPVVQDPAGSFVDVEQLSYYVWVNAEKNPAYRGKTLYLFLAEGVDEMLAIRPETPEKQAAPAPARAPARLADVYATMADWLGIASPGGSGRPIPLSGSAAFRNPQSI